MSSFHLIVLGLIQSSRKSGIRVCFHILHLCFIIYVLGILTPWFIQHPDIWIKGQLCKRITSCNSIVWKLLCYLEKGKKPWSAPFFALIHYTVLMILLNSVSGRLELRSQDVLSQGEWVHYILAEVHVEASGINRMQAFLPLWCILFLSAVPRPHQGTLCSFMQDSLWRVEMGFVSSHIEHAYWKGCPVLAKALAISYVEF